MGWSAWIDLSSHTAWIDPNSGASGWLDISRPIVGSPAAVHRSPEAIDVYARSGVQNRLIQLAWSQSAGWSGWLNLGGEISSSPTACATGPDEEHVFARGMDGRLWWRRWTLGGGWEIWRQLGGTTTFIDSPSAVSRSRDVINVYARRDDNQLMQLSFTRSGGWASDWQVHRDGGLTSASPAAVSMEPNQEHVFVRGMDGRLWGKRWDASTGRWTNYWQLGGSTTFTGAPAVVSRNCDELNVYARRDDNMLMQLSYSSGGGWWSDWQVHRDGGLISAPPAAVRKRDNSEMIFARGLDGGVWHKWWDGGGLRTVRLHFKTLIPPETLARTVGVFIKATQLVYSGAEVWANVRSVEALNQPFLIDVPTQGCTDWGFLTRFNAQQEMLFSNRNNAGPDDIVVYFLRMTMASNAGCAVHPADRPGAIVTLLADEWVPAHEIGHVLGMGHRGSDHLMSPFTGQTNQPPDLSRGDFGDSRFISRV